MAINKIFLAAFLISFGLASIPSQQSSEVAQMIWVQDSNGNWCLAQEINDKGLCS